MGRINVLDRHMVNMIAAGEVIERPASVVKELMENAIDAGAKNITLQIADGGKKLIRVIDDGIGMDADDLEKAFTPHATSKISNADDLLKISTMGFRGEALASIGSVAKVNITSRQPDSVSANCVEIDCGQNQTIKPASGSYGTTVSVENLFYKLPARRKFLKTANTELSHITEQFTRIALANLDIGLTLINNDRKTYSLKADEPLISRINTLFQNLGDDLLPVCAQEKSLEISGYIGKPTSARATSKYQHIFLNKRYIKDRFLSHALKEAYRGLIEPGKFPVVFLFLTMPADSFDVNVHPTKVEVRFDNPNLLHSQILAIAREKLRYSDVSPNAGFSKSFADAPTPQQQNPENTVQRQKAKEAIEDFFNKHQKTDQQKFNFYDQPKNTPSSSFEPPKRVDRDNFYDQSFIKHGPKILQLHDSYILIETDDGFEIVDQHALHERIIYEKMLKNVTSGTLPTQKLLVPASLKISDAQQEIINSNREIFDKLGVDVQDFGPSTVAVHSFPQILEKLDPIVFVQNLLDLLSETKPAPDIEQLLHEILDMAACKAAIKAGKKLSITEIQNLLEQRHTAERSSNCPHGRPTTIKFTLKELEKQFHRT